MRRYENRRVYAGACRRCDREMSRNVEANGQASTPGIFVRCADCGAVSYLWAESSSPLRSRADFLAEPEEVVEWFEYGESEVSAG